MALHDTYYYGRNPTDAIIANYRNLHKIDTDFVGGYTTYAGAHRDRNNGETSAQQIGADYKESMTEPGPWTCICIHARRNNSERKKSCAFKYR